MKSIVVFCGSAEGYNEAYMEAAYELGSMLATQNIRVIYGGAKVGLMGAVADGALAQGGEVIGVIPHFLKTKEIAHEGLTELITVETMHERKMLMNKLCEGVVTLPGGWGTLEELFEMVTWSMLGLHKKPIGILNVNGYYDALKALNANVVQEGFLNESFAKSLLISDTATELLDMMHNYTPPAVAKWLTERTT